MRFLSRNKQTRQTDTKEHERPEPANLNAVCRQIRLLRATQAEIRNELAALRRDVNRIEKKQSRATETTIEDLMKFSPNNRGFEPTLEPPLPAIY